MYWCEWECFKSYGFANKTDFIHYYLNRDDGKKYSNREIHVWINLINNWSDSEDDYITGLNLITRKHWRSFTMRGCMQSEWQNGYVSDEITDTDYIEMCYFNTGMEFIVYESYRDYKSGGDGYSIYVSDVNELLSEYKKIRIFLWDGYTHVSKYTEYQY